MKPGSAAQQPSAPPPSFIRAIVEAESRLREMSTQDPYPVYRLAYDTARELIPLDSFYICLYSEEHQMLFFPYNAEDIVYDAPDTHPLGNGPTSWVIRTGLPFLLTPENESTQLSGRVFGVRGLRSASAMHVPMRAALPGERSRLVGVMSAQSFAPDVYDSDSLDTLQLLADRIALHLEIAGALHDWRRRLADVEARAEACLARARAQANSGAQAVLQLMEALSEIRAAVPVHDHRLQRAILRMRSQCTEVVSRLRHTPGDEPLQPAVQQRRVPPLTSREREVLDLLADGADNAGIARWMGVSVPTVKFHLKNAYAKLGVGSRVQAVRAWTEARATSPENYPKG
jgi:DNA-binding CsgD family transcriptional regulator